MVNCNLKAKTIKYISYVDESGAQDSTAVVHI